MKAVSSIERHLFLEGIFLRYGHDFRGYAMASLNRRLDDLLVRFSERSLLDLLARVLESPELFREMLPYLTINTTEFFRDPEFFKTLRDQGIPLLKTYPSLNIWVAGCSSGEELLSLAIILKEEGLYDRSTIYATDINPHVLKRAREGIFDLSSIQAFTKNYVLAGGKRSPSEYYTAEYGLARFDPSLRENVMFSEHNLATDGVFVEAHLILCRNVFIYFSRDLQNRVCDLFSKSLVHRGLLGIGSKETLKFCDTGNRFDSPIDSPHLYQLKAHAPYSFAKQGNQP